MDTIKVKNLTKKFGDFTAVDKVSFEIKEGKIFGLLGPNGAGKTTTISMLSTILELTSGKAEINNFDVSRQKDEVRHSIGIVFQDPSLDEELTAYENMDFHGRFYGIPKDERKRRIIELLELVELSDKKDHLVKTFSGGMRRRLEIARGLLHHPKVLFLDEPTLGLDAQTRNHLWIYIKNLNKKKNITIILTTHYMEEADRLCDTIAIIDHGKIVAEGTPKSLKESIGGDVITIETEQGEKLHNHLEGIKWINNIKKHDGNITIGLENAEKHVVDIVKTADKYKISINSISIHKPTLEDVFLHFTGKTIREQEVDSKENMRMRHRMWGGRR